MNKRDKAIMDRIQSDKDFLMKKGYTVLFVGLFGSQNYNLDDDLSDIDTKAIVQLPFDRLVRREAVSEVFDRDGGQLDVKDAMTYAGMAIGGNLAALEPLYSKWKIGDYETVRQLRKIELNPAAVIGLMIKKQRLLRDGKYKESEYGKLSVDILRLACIIEEGEGSIVQEFDGNLRDVFMIMKRSKRQETTPEKLAAVVKDTTAIEEARLNGGGKPFQRREDILDVIATHVAAIYEGTQQVRPVNFFSIDEKLKSGGLDTEYFDDESAAALYSDEELEFEVGKEKIVNIPETELLVLLAILISVATWYGFKPIISTIILTAVTVKIFIREFANVNRTN